MSRAGQHPVTVVARRVERSERGQAGGVEVLPFGIVVFVSLTLILTNLWAVVDARFATDAAAREAARHVVEEARLGTSDDLVVAGAHAVVEDTLAGRGRRSTDVAVTAPNGLVRCARIRVDVTVTVPALRVPFLGGVGSSLTVRSHHSELVDPARTGVAGALTCTP